MDVKPMNHLKRSSILCSHEIESVGSQGVDSRVDWRILITLKVGKAEVKLLPKISGYSAEDIINLKRTVVGVLKVLRMDHANGPPHSRESISSPLDALMRWLNLLS